MILQALKSYLQERASLTDEPSAPRYVAPHQAVRRTNPWVSRQQLAVHFALSEDGVEAMMSVWIHKGKVNCKVDQQKNQIHYRWKGAAELQLIQTHR